MQFSVASITHHRSAGVRLLRFAAAVGAAASALGVPAAATASTVTVRAAPSQDAGEDEVHYVAGVGERNVVSVHGERDGETGVWTVRDPGARIVPRGSCASIDVHTVRCRSRGSSVRHGVRLPLFLDRARVQLGDGDDVLQVVDSKLGFEGYGDVVAHGGPGNDRLVGGGGYLNFDGGDGDDELAVGDGFPDARFNGGPGDDRLLGGTAGDTLDGGGGNDQLFGGDGADELTDGDRDDGRGSAGPARDVLDGGLGDDDAVSYRQRRAAVAVDLADMHGDGKAGEGDLVSGMESVFGGRGNDRLAGTNAPNRIYGAGGHDRILGRDGDDYLFASVGGGIFSCGRDRDYVQTQSGATYEGLDFSWRHHVKPDCEQLHPRFGWVLSPYPRMTRSLSVAYRFSCPPNPDPDAEDRHDPLPCSASIRIVEAARRHRLVGTGSIRRGRWVGRMLHVRLTPLGGRLATRRRGVKAAITLRVKSRDDFAAFYDDPEPRWTIDLNVRR